MLTEDRVREIVREEIARFMPKSLGEFDLSKFFEANELQEIPLSSPREEIEKNKNSSLKD